MVAQENPPFHFRYVLLTPGEVTSNILPVPFPYRSELAVMLVLPVPPLVTGRVLQTSALLRATALFVANVPSSRVVLIVANDESSSKDLAWLVIVVDAAPSVALKYNSTSAAVFMLANVVSVGSLP